ncbi:MAG: hypothetical protein QOI31_180 [Solirubrobacterales bacterium]|jgi:hypothetical protein|nr:hypothetical protein [Solirubrobacterales bacterium]
MSGRYRTVALQAVGVAVLAAFVFIAFLRPSEPGDLAGIDAPGGGDSPAAVTPPDDDKEKGGKKGGKDKNGPNGNERSNGNDRRDGNGPPNGPDDDETDTPPDGDDGPDDDQYTDLVSVLMKQVGQPELFKEIDVP